MPEENGVLILSSLSIPVSTVTGENCPNGFHDDSLGRSYVRTAKKLPLKIIPHGDKKKFVLKATPKVTG